MATLIEKGRLVSLRLRGRQKHCCHIWARPTIQYDFYNDWQCQLCGCIYADYDD